MTSPKEGIESTSVVREVPLRDVASPKEGIESATKLSKWICMSGYKPKRGN